MRIVIDLQGAQAANHRRGIGKYSLQIALELARARDNDEVYVILNSSLPEEINTIRAAFERILPQTNILIWHSSRPIDEFRKGSEEYRYEEEVLREAFLSALEPSWVVITSYFEGQHDRAVTSIGTLRRLPTAVVLYDLIPWIHHQHYLTNEYDRNWYISKFDGLKRADLILAISESTRKDALTHLNIENGSVINISAAIQDDFFPKEVSPTQVHSLYTKYGIDRPYVMYTGGIDHRKNIGRLIQSFARLPLSIRLSHQLVVVCHINDDWKFKLQKIVDDSGLNNNDVIFTGYVSNEDLHLLYNACKIFVFPSWHEGFGLPVLEAMKCGKAVIAADSSSLPEVIGRQDALFDPFNLESITSMMARGLVDHDFRQSLERHGLQQAQKFTWGETAKRTWKELREKGTGRTETLKPAKRARLAFISPLPPERSGISGYSISLLMELTRWYQIDVIASGPNAVTDDYVRATCDVISVEEFRQNAEKYNRIIYHFGNSELHKNMFELLAEIPGVVVLHDFYLSAIQMWSEIHDFRFAAMARALLVEGGYQAVAERFGLTSRKFNHDDYPASLSVIQDAIGVIVHSEYSRSLAEKWYGEASRSKFAVVPFLHRTKVKKDSDRVIARRTLGIDPAAIVVCSFGFITASKLPIRLIEAWMASALGCRDDAFCVFVGEAPGEYGNQVTEFLVNASNAQNIKITGWVDDSTYSLWLDAADMAVQLRKDSRGETSAAVYDCIGRGLATIVNAHGFAAELNPKSVCMLPDKFTNEELSKALHTLALNKEQNDKISSYGQLWVQSEHNTRLCAERYYESIEHFYTLAQNNVFGVAQALINHSGSLPNEFLRALAFNNPLQPRRKKIMIDISEMIIDKSDTLSSINRNISLKKLLLDPPEGIIPEPIYYSELDKCYNYARHFVFRILGCPEGIAVDEPVSLSPGDILISPSIDLIDQAPHSIFYLDALNVGLPVLCLLAYPATTPSGCIAISNIQDAVEILLRFGVPKNVAASSFAKLEAFSSTYVGSPKTTWLRVATISKKNTKSISVTYDPLLPSDDNRDNSGATSSNLSYKFEFPIDTEERLISKTSSNNLFQIIIQKDMQLPGVIPEIVCRNINSLKDVYPEYNHRLYSGEAIREFIKEHYGSEVVNAFDSLKPYAYKADLGRYCLLHTFGGIYSDISNRFIRPLSFDSNYNLAAFSDTNGGLGAPWSVNNGIIAVNQGSLEMQLMIRKILEAVRGRFYGRSPLSPTGPDLFGRVLAECYNSKQYLIGDMTCITRTFSQKITFVFLEPSGALVAVRMKASGGDSSELGIDFDNNYNDLWEANNVYE